MIGLAKNFDCKHPWCLVGILLTVLISAHQVAAQEEIDGWSPPYNVSQTSEAVSYPGFAVEDREGQVHVFWAQATGSVGLEVEAPLDIIYYRYWDGMEWSVPVDILAVSEGGYLALHKAVIDPFDRLVLLWHRRGGLELSMAPASTSASVKSWRTIPLDVSGGVADLVVDEHTGNYHVVYVESDRSLFYTRSEDGGMSWSLPVPLGSTDRPGLAISIPRLAINTTGGIHVTWTENAKEYDWNASGVWYTSSFDGGSTWREPRQMVSARSHGRSDVAVDDKGNVHLLWFRGVGSSDGRYHTWSSDAGRTWSAPEVVFPGLSGMPGNPNLLVDSSGTFHFIGGGHNNREDTDRIMHSVWSGEAWSDPVIVSGEQRFAEGAGASIAHGNHLLVTWVNYETTDIWYASRVLDAPQEQVPLMSSEQDIISDQLELTPISHVPTVTPSVTMEIFSGELAQPSEPGGKTEMMLLVAILPVLTLVVIVVSIAVRKPGQ